MPGQFVLQREQVHWLPLKKDGHVEMLPTSDLSGKPGEEWLFGNGNRCHDRGGAIVPTVPLRGQAKTHVPMLRRTNSKMQPGTDTHHITGTILKIAYVPNTHETQTPPTKRSGWAKKRTKGGVATDVRQMTGRFRRKKKNKTRGASMAIVTSACP